MSRPSLLLSVSALFLLSAKKIDYVQDCLKEAGGAARYARVETVDWSFSVARPSAAGVVTWHGRQRLRRVGGSAESAPLEPPVPGALRTAASSAASSASFLIREDLDTPEGLWTVWAGPVSRVEKDGLPVTDEAVVTARVADARLRAFWELAPFPLLAQSSGGRYLGSGYFQTRLVRRVELNLNADALLKGPVVLQLDAETALLRGAVYGDGDETESLLFDNHETRQNLLNTAGLWTRFNAAGKRVEVLRANAVVFNSFIDNELFTALSAANQGE